VSFLDTLEGICMRRVLRDASPCQRDGHYLTAGMREGQERGKVVLL
jgi:hypothetical protein